MKLNRNQFNTYRRICISKSLDGILERHKQNTKPTKS